MPAWELERDNSDEDFEHDEREDRGPIEEEDHDEDRAEFYREANREAARRTALFPFPWYDPTQQLHF